MTPDPDRIDPAVRRRAVRAAQGLEPFDLLLTGGTVVDVATGSLRPADVGVVGPLIASVHPTGRWTDAAAFLDCTGRWIAPGLIDMHVHVESAMLTPAAYAEAVCPRGTTTIFTDPHELANVGGVPAVRWFCDASRGLPVRFLVQAPSCVPPLPGLELSGADLHGPDIAEMLSWPEVAGLAEVMDMYGVLQSDRRMADVVQAGLDSGKLVSGHAAGLAGAALQGYLAAGIGSDHEIFGPDEVLDKLRAGLTVELRGMLEADLPEVVRQLSALPEFPPTLVGATDDLFASTLLDEGGIDSLCRRLVAAGLSPVRALRVATLHAALRLGRPDLGLVAAGRRADLVVLDDLASVTVGEVLSDGLHVASAGAMLAPVVAPPTDPPLHTVHLPELTERDFRLPVDAPDGVVRLMALHSPVTTSWSEVDVLVDGGLADVPVGHLLQVAIHRHGRAPHTPQAALLAGWGEWTGAIATTLSHDTHNLVVFGRDPADMLLAARTVVAHGGGIAVVRDGRVLAEIALPIAGILATGSAAEVAQAQREVEQAGLSIGLPTAPLAQQPLFHVLASTLPCIPGPHLTDVGVVDGDTGRIVPSLLATVGSGR
jgi:adenine deaminase